MGANFIFLSTYPTNEIFEVEETPMFDDFKKGRFYIYDEARWGDGSPNEFTSNPIQIGVKI